MLICLVEDSAVVNLEPLTLTRSVLDLRLGAGTLGGKILQAFGIAGSHGLVAMVLRPHVARLKRRPTPDVAVNDRDRLTRGPVLVVNGRWLPPFDFVAPAVNRPTVGLCDGLPACAWVGPGQAAGLELHSVDSWFEELRAELDCVELGGEWIKRPWDLVSRNAAHLAHDIVALGCSGLPGHHRDVATVVGPADRLSVHETARIDPFTVFDTTKGPIRVEAGAWIQPFTRIEGPSLIGRDSHLFRANVREGVTIGPHCRIGGEVEESIIHGHSNKYHEGFLGHAYVGEWVNIGAITSNSDLRNDYGEVSVPLRGDPVPTGLAKVGCFIGDHTRIGMGSMLNTGTAIGVMCNVLPAGVLLPKHVPSFTAVSYGRVAPGFPLEQMFATARTVKGRRGQEFSADEEQFFRDLYDHTRLERERAFQRARDRRGELWPVAAAATV